MKKFTKLILALFIVFSFSGCSEQKEEPVKIVIDKENKFNDLVSYQIETIRRPKQIAPDITGNYYTFYKPTDPDNIFIDITMQMTNLQKKELKLEDAIKASFLIDQTEYVAAMALVSDDGKALSHEVALKAEGTSKVHFYAEIKPALIDQKIEFKFTTNDEENSSEAVMTFKLADVIKKYENKNLNDTIVFENHGEMVLQSVNLTKKLEPAQPTGLYSYYKVMNDTDTFVVLTTTVKNNSQNDLLASNIATVRMLDPEGNEYPVNPFYEKEDHSNLAPAESVTLNPGKSALVHYVFEVSDAVANGEKTVKIIHDGKVYLVKI